MNLKILRAAPTLLTTFALLLGCATTPLPRTAKTDYDAIIVGGGMGGLSAATHLAVGGMKVLLVEQHYKVGGCTTSFYRKGFNFDAALHEMSLGGGDGGLVPMILERAGMTENVELIPVPQLGRSVFPNLDFTAPHGVEEFFGSLKERWPKEEKNLDEFRTLLEDLAEEISELRSLYMANPVKALLTKLTLPLRQRTIFKYHNKTIDDVMDEFFEDKELKAVLSQFWAYYGPPPSKQWAIIYLVAQYSYILNGGWQIKGSSQALADAYQARIEELGGEVLTDTLVTAINMEDGRIAGITTEEGETYTSRFVVSNADPFQTYYKLIGRDKTPKKISRRIDSMKPANSFVGVYLGLDVPSSFFGIEEYEVFLNTSFDEEAMYEAAMSGDYANSIMSLTFYDKLGDPFYAPEGKSVVNLLTYADIANWPEPGEEYTRQKEEMMDTLITMAETLMPGLRDHIEVAVGMTPRTMKNFTLNQEGVPYGWNFTPDQQNRLEIPSPIPGLYHAGSWTWPAHSVSMAQVSGFLAARMILKEDGRLEE